MGTTEETLIPGMLLDGVYRLERRLGVGGHGTVWLASDESGRLGQVAVKVLSHRLAESEDVRQRFRAEAVILRTLQHPGIVRALDFASQTDRLYIVMEYLAGRSLASEMVARARSGEVFRVDEVADRFEQVCYAVAAAHARGIVHRDLKPQNVLVLGEGDDIVTKVLDFGIAKILSRPGEDATTLGRMLGSYLYSSPEQVSRKPIDGRADVFALGSVLFEMLTLHRAWAVDDVGRHARVGDRSLRFEGSNAYVEILRRIVGGPRPKLTNYRPDLPDVLNGVILKALEVSPDERFESVDALRAAFADVTRSRHPVLVKSVPDKAPSLPRLPVPGGGPVTTTSLVVDDYTVAQTVAEVPDTRLLDPRESLPRGMSEEARGVPPVFGQLALVALGGLVGVLGYHFAFGHRAEPPPPPLPQIEPATPPPIPVVVPRSEAAEQTEPTPFREEKPDRTVQRNRTTGRTRLRRRRAVTPHARRRSGLRAQLDRLRVQADVEALEALVAKVRAAAAKVPSAKTRSLIDRLAVASLTTGDLEGLSQCIDLLEGRRYRREQHPP